MFIKVTDAQYINGYKIKITFNNGTTKIVDFEPHLWGEVFNPLKDKEYFKQFTLNPFTIEWRNGADFSPEYLYNIGI
ncbi:MAG: DUF2442 domain-containing protein [Bacteroidia bacterium]|nr:DUF2442 domain-containing protein [Bacteroidia bacterium]